VLGVVVKGSLDSLEELIRHARIEEVVLSTTAIAADREQRLREVCRRLKVPVRRFRLEITE